MIWALDLRFGRANLGIGGPKSWIWIWIWIWWNASLDKNNPEKQGPARGKTKQKKRTHKHKEQQRTHRNGRNSGARKVNQRYCLGLYSSKFHPKASNSKDEEHHSLITLTRQESLFGILQKIRKPETNTSFLKKKERGWGGRGEEKC